MYEVPDARLFSSWNSLFVSKSCQNEYRGFQNFQGEMLIDDLMPKIHCMWCDFFSFHEIVVIGWVDSLNFNDWISWILKSLYKNWRLRSLESKSKTCVQHSQEILMFEKKEFEGFTINLHLNGALIVSNLHFQNQKNKMKIWNSKVLHQHENCSCEN